MYAFRNALITGASSGLGRAVAVELAARGACVWVCARREPELRALVVEIEARGGRARARVLDVADTARVQEEVAAWDAQCGGFDLVLANAGVGALGPAGEIPWRDQETVLRVNVLGSIATLCAAAGPMLARGRGTLAGVSSLAGQRGMPTSAAYSASKAALSTFLESLRIGLGPLGITVVDIRPGFVRTPMTDKNAFAMPFLWPVARAARVSVDALERGAAVCAFPWQMAWAMKLARSMPDGLWRTLARRLPQTQARGDQRH